MMKKEDTIKSVLTTVLTPLNHADMTTVVSAAAMLNSRSMKTERL